MKRDYSIRRFFTVSEVKSEFSRSSPGLSFTPVCRSWFAHAWRSASMSPILYVQKSCKHALPWQAEGLQFAYS